MDYVEIATWIVGLFFLIPGVIELVLWRRFVERFVAWGYPSWWPLVTYPLKIAGGLLALIHSGRPIGLAICGAISLAALATIIVRKDKAEYKAIPINIIVLALIGLVYANG